MPDEEITLFNACTDLVSLKKWEAFPLHLLGSKRPGEWVGVRDSCLQVGVPPGDVEPQLFATWLPDPRAQPGYAVILFYDDESKWSMAAHYNRLRLLGDRPPNQAVPPSGEALTASAGSTSGQTAPATESA
jgi:hypothetical protein